MNIDSLIYELADKQKNNIYMSFFFKTSNSDYNSVVDLQELSNMQYEFIALIDYNGIIRLLKIADFLSDRRDSSPQEYDFGGNGMATMSFMTLNFKKKTCYIVDKKEFDENWQALTNIIQQKQIKEADLTDVPVME